ncbi:hypothetical protein GALMADRAFT_242654 [Galerina marginata CBS 339.88]|uniref:DUF6534 domain-containing protein n=1 Tax=Galerina marginata (strain CBS 339.88) TaxID=685588 RepID=A0A067TMW5_GALM3|nr:hypothetical protein GALMADRAFT_242654 [Galerina marginata CBS 339.88]
MLIDSLIVGNALATIGASTLWGVGVHQLSQFYFQNASSSRRLKVLVGWLGVWETVRQFVTMAQVVSSVDQPPLWDKFLVSNPNGCIVFGDNLLYMSSALVAIPAQGYLVYRTWEFAKRPRAIPYLAAPMLLFQLVLPIALISTRHDTEACSHNFPTNVGLSLLIATFSVGAVLDVITCVALTALLWKEYMNRSKVLKSTSSMLIRLIMLSVNTGMWTAILAVLLLSILHFTTKMQVQPFFGYYHLLSPLYFLTVLVNLNVRGFIRDAANKRGLSNVQLSLYLQTVSPDSASTFHARDLSGFPPVYTTHSSGDLDVPLDIFGPPHSEGPLEK